MADRTNPTVVFPRAKAVCIEDRPVPEPGRNQLLVRTRMTMISPGTELSILVGEAERDTAWAKYGQFPFVPGYNNIGIVEALGEGAEAHWLGKRIAHQGPHAAWSLCQTSQARPIPDDVSDEQAVFFALAEIAMNGVRRGQITWGESVVIFGLGLVGQLAARFCLLAGADPVIGVDVLDSRLDLLPDDPAVQPINAKTTDVQAAIKAMTAGRMADAAFEVTGVPNLIPREILAMHRMGRFVLLSSPRGSSDFDFHDLCNAPSFTIIGAHNSSHPPTDDLHHPWTMQRHAQLFFDWVLMGRLDVAPLLSHRLAAAEAPRMYQSLLDDRSPTLGIVFDW